MRTTRTISSTIEIRAPLDAVWRILADFPAYREWNPHLREVRGRPREGGRLMVLSHPKGSRPVALRPKLIVWKPPREFRWRGTFISPILFSGEHGFRLEPLPGGRVRFIHEETFRGLLVPVYARLRLPATKRGFGQMNEALRERAEALNDGEEVPAASQPAPSAAEKAP